MVFNVLGKQLLHVQDLYLQPNGKRGEVVAMPMKVGLGEKI